MFEISDSCVCCAAGKDDSDSRTSNSLLIFTCNSNRASSSSMLVSHDHDSCLSTGSDGNDDSPHLGPNVRRYISSHTRAHCIVSNFNGSCHNSS